jgi:hypothetical protein
MHISRLSAIFLIALLLSACGAAPTFDGSVSGGNGGGVVGSSAKNSVAASLGASSAKSSTPRSVASTAASLSSVASVQASSSSMQQVSSSSKSSSAPKTIRQAALAQHLLCSQRRGRSTNLTAPFKPMPLFACMYPVQIR